MEMQKSEEKRDRSTSSVIAEVSERKVIKTRELKSLLDGKLDARFREKKTQVTEDHAMSIDGSPTIEPKTANDQLNLNSDPCPAGKLSSDDIQPSDGNPQEKGSTVKCKNQQENICTSSRGLDLDLNAEDVASSVNTNSFHPYNRLDILKSADVSECASSTGPLYHGRDPFKVWKEMKQNGFMSSSSSFHGGMPAPKQRSRKNKNDMKRLELAKKEQADKFARLAAPSGLLNELNPGIINHVRNKKQVHNIIEALVKAEKPGAANRAGNRKKMESYEDLGMNQHKKRRPTPLCKSISLTSEKEHEDGGSIMVHKLDDRTLGSLSNPFSKDDTLALKMSSSLSRASEMSMSINESTLSSVNSLSVKAATIASQWLELLHQDIKGRLSALRRSKKRVDAVISTELPSLIFKEFSVNQENETPALKHASGSNCTAADMHRVKWSALFGQMDKALAEEAQQLEIWLNQVKDMQLHCEYGLQTIRPNTVCGLPNLGATSTDNVSRSVKAENSERELAVRAAAASIYSTCKFLLSKGDVSCF